MSESPKVIVEEWSEIKNKCYYSIIKVYIDQKEVYFVKKANQRSFILELKLSALVWQLHILKTRFE